MNDQRIGYVKTEEKRLCTRHTIGFERGMTSTRFLELIKEVPPMATLGEVITDEDDDVTTITFTEEWPID